MSDRFCVLTDDAILGPYDADMANECACRGGGNVVKFGVVRHSAILHNRLLSLEEQLKEMHQAVRDTLTWTREDEDDDDDNV